MSVATTERAPSYQAVPIGRRRRMLPPGWPLYALYFGFPLWWALGAAQLIWPVFAIPMALALARKRVTLRWPRGFGVWLAFIFWMLASVTALHDAHRIMPFLYRAALYLSATITFLYVYNFAGTLFTRAKVVSMLAFLWLVVVAGGMLGLLMPHGGFTSLLQLVLPHGLSGNPFVKSLIHPQFAQTQSIVGFSVARPRPSAPFVYTNEWGSNLALLTPFALAATAMARTPRVRLFLQLAIAAAFLPVILSLNRGMWIALTAMTLYVAGRFALRGRVKALLAILTVIAAATAVIAATSLSSLVLTRATTQSQSNTARARLYETVLQSMPTSPFFGFATPLPPGTATAAVGSGQTRGGNAAIGTQGQLWLVLYSHGWPGLVFFAGWLLLAWVRTLRVRSQLAFWCNATLLTALLIFPVYGMLPGQLHTVMVAAALALQQWAPKRRVRRRRAPALAGAA